MSVSGASSVRRCGNSDRFRLLVLRIDDVHGEGLVAVGVARQRHQQPVAVPLRLGGLAVDVAGPELGALGQLELLELLLVVLHHERGLRQQLAFVGEHGG